MCGEGIPDFYAQEAIGKDPSCINPLADKLLKKYYEKLGYCSLDMNDLGYQTDENGDFVLEDCLKKVFVTYYNSKQAVVGFDALFRNKKNLNDKFVAFWDATSSRFAGNPYVVGYDPLNEPSPANPARDPTMNVHGVMDRKYLTPTYGKIFDKAYSNDNES